ncbi:MAG: hypothetical protein S0880_00830 [Actinomycetota bacterium]|nr:hypothetical protein [Actinomycetota bacterium]
MSDGDVNPEADPRAELAAVHAALDELPRDAFADRAPLLARRAELSRRLRAATAADPDVASRWAERAAGTRGPEPTPFIQSHGEGGGSGA